MQATDRPAISTTLKSLRDLAALVLASLAAAAVWAAGLPA